MNTRQMLFSLFVGFALMLVGSQLSALVPAVSTMLWVGAALVAATALNVSWHYFSPALARAK